MRVRISKEETSQSFQVCGRQEGDAESMIL